MFPRPLPPSDSHTVLFTATAVLLAVETSPSDSLIHHAAIYDLGVSRAIDTSLELFEVEQARGKHIETAYHLLLTLRSHVKDGGGGECHGTAWH